LTLRDFALPILFDELRHCLGFLRLDPFLFLTRCA
jgi:hypothetical protein